MYTVNISQRHMQTSSALTDTIRAHVAKLTRFYDRIMGCDITVWAPPARAGSQRRTFGISIKVIVPGGTIDVHVEPSSHNSEQDAYVTLNDAFHTVRRRLEDFARRKSGRVKRHSLPGFESGTELVVNSAIESHIA